MDIISLLSSDNFIIYNKEFAKQYGVEEAILLGAMCSYQRGFKNEWFYREQEKIIEDTALKLYSLRTATKSLIRLGILEVKKMGIPAKSYYKINEEQLQRYLMSRTIENDRSSDCENDRSSDIENDTTNNINTNNTNNTTIKNEEINNKDKKINNNTENIKQIIDYLNEKADKRYTTRNTANIRHINARLKEKYTLDDFKQVIDKKVADWKGTDMEQYLRPETLFGTKFESYLNSAKTSKPKSIREIYNLNIVEF